MKQGMSIRAGKSQRAAARVLPLAVCGACGWCADEPPGACATPLCGLRDAIHVRRNETRAKLGLPALPILALPVAAKASAPQKPHEKRQRPAVRLAPVCAAVAVEAPVEPPPGGVTLKALGSRSCRWPHGDPRSADFRYCGARSMQAGKPYCATHAQRAWRAREVGA